MEQPRKGLNTRSKGQSQTRDEVEDAQSQGSNGGLGGRNISTSPPPAPPGGEPRDMRGKVEEGEEEDELPRLGFPKNFPQQLGRFRN